MKVIGIFDVIVVLIALGIFVALVVFGFKILRRIVKLLDSHIDRNKRRCDDNGKSSSPPPL